MHGAGSGLYGYQYHWPTCCRHQAAYCDDHGRWYAGRGWIDLWRTDGPSNFTDGYYEPYFFKDELLQLLGERNTDKPLFLYYASRLVHAPLQAPQVYLDMYKHIDDPVRQKYHAMVSVLDDNIGNLTQALKEKGMWDNTILVIQSDNGGPIYAVSTPSSFIPAWMQATRLAVFST